MHLIPAHGDAGFYGARVPFLIFRPSLLNIASLGNPAEIVALFESVMGTADTNLQMWDAMAVLLACAEDKDAATEAVGYYGVMGWQEGEMPLEHVLHLARHMLLHGVVGDVEIKTLAASSTPMQEFKASQFVALAVAHLGMSTTDAWGLSMTALVDALNAKFPQVQNPKKDEPGGSAPTMLEHDEAMAWFDEIDRSRKNGK